MVKHTQTVRRQQATNCLSVFDHFVKLALKGLKYLLTFPSPVNSLHTYNFNARTYAKLFVFSEVVILKIFYRYIKSFAELRFSCNVSLGLICIFIFIFCRFGLLFPRSYIVTLIPVLNKFHKQTNLVNTSWNKYEKILHDICRESFWPGIYLLGKRQSGIISGKWQSGNFPHTHCYSVFIH